jgi:hypothetical protein
MKDFVIQPEANNCVVLWVGGFAVKIIIDRRDVIIMPPDGTLLQAIDGREFVAIRMAIETGVRMTLPKASK